MAATLLGCHRSPLVVEGGGGSSSGVAVETSSTSTGATTGRGSDESSTGEPQFEGPGCGEPPPCDRGTFEGHMRIESAEDLAVVAGFTEVTGALEIMNSEDLVCLDALACLEVVGRDVRIQDNAALRSTEGLGALREIGQGGGFDTISGAIIVTHNAVLERLAGFAVHELHRSVILVENPSLRAVSGFRQLRTVSGLHITSNPKLDSLAGLTDVEKVALCYVSFNVNLCSAEAVAVCGGLESPPSGAAVYNSSECPDAPDGTFGPLYPGWGCHVLQDDCPPDQKCMPFANDGGSQPNDFACRPIVENPVAPHESCSLLGGEAEGFDTCERHSMCIDGGCVPTCRGGHNGGACLSSKAKCDVDGGGHPDALPE